ncbi:hypothetical protein Y032_0191g1280 [Ancylostoma ceylanicum]|uniref:Uncharacterized protein n=1 Tax=Ancylostoma ceylanicum TaxID=53326 RepID=A0A016SQI9_9BILA|nr:hypothetical protein Y032_0191g1280 [Ancylostoma ceylanicum]
MLWLLIAYLVLPPLEGRSPTPFLPKSERYISTFAPQVRDSPSLRRKYHDFSPYPEHEREPRSVQDNHRETPTLNSFHDTEYFSQYGLDDRVYNASFLLRTLDTLKNQRDRMSWRSIYYSIPLFHEHFRDEGHTTFAELANQALAKAKNTTVEVSDFPKSFTAL